jgi:hypothetical protein
VIGGIEQKAHLFALDLPHTTGCGFSKAGKFAHKALQF